MLALERTKRYTDRMPNNVPALGSFVPDSTLALLTLTRIRGLGPVRTKAALRSFGSPEAVLGASAASLKRVEGIGGGVASAVGRDQASARRSAIDELEEAAAIGARLVAIDDPEYPALLRPLDDAPLLLWVRGRTDWSGADRFGIGVVGSRRCSAYGLEQAERFGASLARSGLSIVSGGARGIDTAAHRGALAARGRTIVLLGCGLGHVYPPENRAMFDRIAEESGAIVSELPIGSPPSPEHFPSRNRLISGMSLGVLVVEAGRRSGALITARLAAEDHGREVFALPGRVDHDACAGSLDLIKQGGAQLVTGPEDVLAGLEAPARHQHLGTHEHRYPPLISDSAPPHHESMSPEHPTRIGRELSDAERVIVQACTEPMTTDAIQRVTGLPASTVARHLTVLELAGAVRREGGLFRARG